jgi:hypothetical protein
MFRKGFGGLLTLALTLAASAYAHEIPSSVRVQAFLEPKGDRMRLLVRVPLAAMRDMTVPTNPLGYLDLTRVDSVLRDAAILWIADYVELYEGDERLANPTLVAALVSLPSDRSFDDYQSALAHVRARRFRPRPRSTGPRDSSTCSSSIQSNRTNPSSRSIQASSAWACRC